jgi:hypothetical protein
MYNGRRVEIFCVQDEGVGVAIIKFWKLERQRNFSATVGKIIFLKS